MSTVATSFHTTVKQMTEMSQQKINEISQRRKKQLGADELDFLNESMAILFYHSALNQ